MNHKARVLALLDEALGSFKYKFPTDPDEALYDFYALSLIPDSVETYRDSTNVNFDAVIAETKETLFRGLRDELLRVGLFCITSELRHADPVISSGKGGWERIKAEQPGKFTDLLLKLTDYEDTKTQVFRFRGKSPAASIKDESNSYLQAWKKFVKTWKGSTEDFLTQASYTFAGNPLIKWATSYGGPKWAQIAEGIKALYLTRNVHKMQAAIDHVYDLEHNTGFALNKLRRYAGMQKHLTFKFSAAPYQILARASHQMQGFIKTLAQQDKHIGTLFNAKSMYSRKVKASGKDEVIPTPIPFRYMDDKPPTAVTGYKKGSHNGTFHDVFFDVGKPLTIKGGSAEFRAVLRRAPEGVEWSGKITSPSLVGDVASILLQPDGNNLYVDLTSSTLRITFTLIPNAGNNSIPIESAIRVATELWWLGTKPGALHDPKYANINDLPASEKKELLSALQMAKLDLKIHAERRTPTKSQPKFKKKTSMAVFVSKWKTRYLARPYRGNVDKAYHLFKLPAIDFQSPVLVKVTGSSIEKVQYLAILKPEGKGIPDPFSFRVLITSPKTVGGNTDAMSLYYQVQESIADLLYFVVVNTKDKGLAINDRLLKKIVDRVSAKYDKLQLRYYPSSTK